MSARARSLALVALAVAATAAHADTAETLEAVGSDVVGAGLVIGGWRAESGIVGVAGVGVLAFGAPTVRLANGSTSRGLFGLATRLGGTLLGAGYGQLTRTPCRNPFCALDAFRPFVFGALGLGLGIVADWALGPVVIDDEPAAMPTARVLSIGGSF